MQLTTRTLGILGAGFCVALAASLLFIIFVPLHPLSQEQLLFHIEKGEGSKDIATHLKSQGFIRSATAFRLFAVATGTSHTLQAGTYAVSPAMSTATIAKKLGTGDIATISLTILEGWNRKDIDRYLLERKVLASLNTHTAPAELEGYLFPDTYVIPIDSTPAQLFERMRKNFDKKVTQEMRAAASSQGKTLREIVVMASLIEKEVRTKEDKKIVSGILWKRLAAGIPLQVDATIAFLVEKPGNELTKDDLKTPSPYNTYLNRGLPVGPIGNPGLESMQAALEPTENPYLYYLSTKEGETIFSRTLEEHNIAKTKHLK